MDQAVLIDSIGKHLDALEFFVNAIILVSVAVAWAGIQRSSEIEILGTKFNRRYAFFAVAVLYLIANMTILILFLHVGDLVALLKGENAVKGISRLLTHSWVLNPFSYFGGSGIAQIYSSEGYGLLIAIWWLCNASLSTLMDDKRNKPAQVLIGLFLLIGLASMFAIQRVFYITLVTLKKSAPKLYLAVTQTTEIRMIGVFLGILVGGLIFSIVNILQDRWLKKA